MSQFREELLARKNKLEQQLKPYNDLLNELAEVNKAIAALDPPRCDGRCMGCSICRNGPDYR
jgi:hypothetical protein